MQVIFSTIGSAIAILTVIILMLRFSIEEFAIRKQKFDLSYLRYYMQHFIIGVTVLVVAVPEGLPLAVTRSLAYSVRVSHLRFLSPLHTQLG